MMLSIYMNAHIHTAPVLQGFRGLLGPELDGIAAITE
jgi:hypothetical protein